MQFIQEDPVTKIRALFDCADPEWQSYLSPLTSYFSLTEYEFVVVTKEQVDAGENIRKAYDIIVKGNFGLKLSEYYTVGKPHIYISYERYDVAPNKDVPYSLRFSNVLQEEYSEIEDIIYLPYVSNFLVKGKYTNFSCIRTCSVAYCSSNTVPIREHAFNEFVLKFGEENCSSFGRCFGSYKSTNKRLEGDHKSKQLLNALSNCKFMLCFENADVPGYITEKIALAYRAGCIPIYLGADVVNEYFNSKSFINLKNFNSVKSCVEYVYSLGDREIDNIRRQPIFIGDYGGFSNKVPQDLSITNPSDDNVVKFRRWADKLVTKPINILL